MFQRNDPESHYKIFVLPFLEEFGTDTLAPELALAATKLAACIEALSYTRDEWVREGIIDDYWLWWARFQAWTCEG
ncbi:MAG: hypothetical protein AB1489_03310 [Acidobacteriota bacterium]